MHVESKEIQQIRMLVNVYCCHGNHHAKDQRLITTGNWQSFSLTQAQVFTND